MYKILIKKNRVFPLDGNRIISCSFDRTVKFWNSKTYSVSHQDARILSVAFSPGGKYVATGARDKRIKITETRSGQEIDTFIGHNRFFFSTKIFFLKSNIHLF